MVEIYGYGEVPYFGWGSRRVWKEVVKGFTHAKPMSCPHSVFQIMVRCWKMDKWDRPNFATLERMFKNLENKTSGSASLRRKSSKLGDNMLNHIGKVSLSEMDDMAATATTDAAESTFVVVPAPAARPDTEREAAKFAEETKDGASSHVSQTSIASDNYCVMFDEPMDGDGAPLTAEEQAALALTNPAPLPSIAAEDAKSEEFLASSKKSSVTSNNYIVLSSGNASGDDGRWTTTSI